MSKLTLSDASAPWQIDAGALHAEWKRDAALRDQIAGAVGRYKPRLVVERLVLSPGHITAGDRVSVRASVRNIGGSTSVEGESIIVVGPFAAERASVPPLPPQGTRDVEITATVPVERDGKLDVSSYVHEGLDVSRVVLDVARKPRPSLALHCTLPDATSSWIGARRVSQVSLAKFRATCEVANLGDAEAANIEVAIASNGFDAAKQPIAKLAPLASTVVTLETKPANASGTIDLTFVASAADTKPVKHTRKVVIR
jgi:subtilase family serine protease